jgi:predicted DNA repair protein MutK
MSAGLAAVLKQAAAMSKKATVRTAGIVGDDLAINSKQLMGGQPDRKLPMVYAVAKGSLKNKALLIPTALALSITFPGLIMPALTIGGAYLCYEGIDKFLHKKPKTPEKPGKTEAQVKDHAAWEKRHVKKAIKTDLILSAEIVAVSLWTVAGAPFIAQAAALAAAGIAMTVGVYGIVGGIIKLEDIGAAMMGKQGNGIFAKATRGLGKALKKSAPPLVKTIGVIGTVAMFLVGGGMVVHGLPGGEHMMANALNLVGSNAILQGVATGALETVAGVAAGFAAIPVMRVIERPIEKAWEFSKKLISKLKPSKPEPDEADEEADAPAPAAPAPDNALKATSDIRGDLNAAAKPVGNDSKPADNTPVKPPPAAGIPKP